MIEHDRLVRLLDSHAAALELYAAQWVANPTDVVQEAFIRLTEQSPLPDHILAWLYRVVRNGAISAARSESRRQRHETRAGNLTRPWFRDDPTNPIDGEIAANALQELPDESREVVVARIWGQLTFEEIGELVGVSGSTVHRRYESALNDLRKKLGVSCENHINTKTTS